jgi:hypothetical protein
MQRATSRRRLVLLVLPVALFLASEESYAATSPPVPPDIAAILVYVETIPTGSGAKAVRPGAEQKAPLPPATARKLRAEAGRDARILEEIATSSQYGAPQRKLPLAHDRPEPDGDDLSPRVLATAVTAAADVEEGRLLGLTLVLGAITAVAFGMAARRRAG